MADCLDLYHLYRDHTFFQYEVVMTRDDQAAGIQGERYVMSVSVFSGCCFSLGGFISSHPFLDFVREPTLHHQPLNPSSVTPFGPNKPYSLYRRAPADYQPDL